jgi:hypothetical protein
MTVAFEEPSPKTVCVAVFHKSQALQSIAAVRNPEIVRIVGIVRIAPVPAGFNSPVIPVRAALSALFATIFIVSESSFPAWLRKRCKFHAAYAARSFTSADVADLAQCAQQKYRPLTSVP